MDDPEAAAPSSARLGPRRRPGEGRGPGDPAQRRGLPAGEASAAGGWWWGPQAPPRLPPLGAHRPPLLRPRVPWGRSFAREEELGSRGRWPRRRAPSRQSWPGSAGDSRRAGEGAAELRRSRSAGPAHAPARRPREDGAVRGAGRGCELAPQPKPAATGRRGRRACPPALQPHRASRVP